ncbi:hypothetical protein Tco_0621570 [Tanacetum coccineum]
MFMHGHGHPELAKKLNDKIPQTVDEMWERKGQGRSMGTCAPYARREGFTPLTKTLKDILAMDNVNFPPPPSMIEEAVALGRLAHLVKDIRQSGKKNKGSAKGKEKVLNMNVIRCSEGLRTMLMSIYDFMTLTSWDDVKVAEESHHLSSPLLERVPSHTTTPTAEGAMILLPTPNEIAASLLDPRLAKKSKGPSQVRVRLTLDIAPEPSRPSRNRKLKKRALEAGSSALELGQAEGINEADSTNFYTEIENSLERDEGTSMRATSARTPRLGKRLCAPPSMTVVIASGPSHVRTSAHASTSGRSFSLGGATVSGHAGKSGVEVMRRQIDPLDSLSHSALARDVEHDQIPKDDFGTATHGEEIDLTLFPLALGPYQMSCPYEVLCWFPMAGYVKVLRSEVTTLDGKLERMQKDCAALGQENRELCSKKDAASEKVKELQTELTDARVVSIGLSEEFSQTDAKLSDQALVVRDLQNELALEKAKSQGYKDAVDGLKEEVTRFFVYGVESLVRKLLSSDKFHAALAHVASLGINYGVERGLHIGHTDAEFEVAAQKVSNFHIGAKANFNKALIDFLTTPFPFLGKIVGAAGSTLSEVTQVLPDMHIRSVTSVLVTPPIANEDANQVPLEHASDDSAAGI